MYKSRPGSKSFFSLFNSAIIPNPEARARFGGTVLREVHAVGHEEPRNLPQVSPKR